MLKFTTKSNVQLMENAMERLTTRVVGRIRFGTVRRLMLLLLLGVCAAAPAEAQFSSGSSGANGSFPPYPAGTSEIPSGTQYLLWNMTTGLIRYCSQYEMSTRLTTCTVELATAQIPAIPTEGLRDGVFHFTDVDLRSSVNIVPVGNASNSPLTILSQNSIRFAYGTYVYADGLDATHTYIGLHPNVSLPGALPGPGGFAGGSSGFPGPPPTDGSTGFGIVGGTGGHAAGTCSVGPAATFGTGAGAATSTTLVPLLGGAGGGGGAASTSCGIGRDNGAPGGGGGGAVLMVATTEINLPYAIFYLNGGDGGYAACGCFSGGGGAGGALRLVAPLLLSSSATYAMLAGGNSGISQAGGGGTFRIEGNASQFNFYPFSHATGSVVATPGPVLPLTTPSLRITSLGGIAVPAAPTGNVNTPDVMFQTPPTDPVVVSLSASNIPPGTTAKVRVTPQVGPYNEVTSTAFVGSPAISTATASVSIPAGFGAVAASATFACDGLICGGLAANERATAVVEVVADSSGSRAVVIKADGTRIPLPAIEF